jgi:hypothetical protein
MKLFELKRMINDLPENRLGEECFMYHPFYRRLFKIEAIDDLKTVRPDEENRIVLITADEPYG